MSKMQLIPKTFKANGYDYRLLKRLGSMAIYEQLSGSRVVGYEVHKIRIEKAGEVRFPTKDGSIKVRRYPDREKLASNSKFGVYGWSYDTLKEAENKFDSFINMPK